MMHCHETYHAFEFVNLYRRPLGIRAWLYEPSEQLRPHLFKPKQGQAFMPRILLRHFDEFNPAAHMSRKHKLTHSRDGRVSVCAFPVALLVDLMPIESEPIFSVYTQWLQPILAQICREIFRAGLEPSWLSPMRRTVPCFRQMNCPSAYPRPRRINDYVTLQILEFTQT